MNPGMDRGILSRRNVMPFLDMDGEMDCLISFLCSNIRYLAIPIVLSLSFKVSRTCEYYNDVSCLTLQGQSHSSMSVELRQVAVGFAYRVRSFCGYDVNGYRFRTTSYE